MGSVVVALPWRDRGIRLRQIHHDRIRRWFADNLPGVDVIDVDGQGEQWSLAAARNAGVEAAQALGADVVVVCDADNYPEMDALNEAIDAAHDGLVHLPYTEYVNGSFHWAGSVGGIYVTTPDAWWASGGQDPRFTGWGCEDHAHVHSHLVLMGASMVRHAGTLTHLPHPAPRERDPHDPQHQAAAALLGRYRDAADVESMRALVEEWH